MSVELDHVFVMCAPGAPEAAALTRLGLKEGPGTHIFEPILRFSRNHVFSEIRAICGSSIREICGLTAD